jgi:hypothetical protein
MFCADAGAANKVKNRNDNGSDLFISSLQEKEVRRHSS